MKDQDEKTQIESPEPRNTQEQQFSKNPLEMNIDEIEEIISEKELIEIPTSQSIEMSEEKSPEQELIIWGKYNKPEQKKNKKIKKPKGKFQKKINKQQIFKEILDEIENDGKKASSKFKRIIYIFESIDYIIIDK